MSINEGKVNAGNDNGHLMSRQSSTMTELEDFKNVTNNLVQDALTVWADLWAELDNQVELDDAENRNENQFEPSCGWNKYLEKMWALKHYLDFVKRLSQQ